MAREERVSCCQGETRRRVLSQGEATVNKADFYQNLVEASTIEQRFIFLDRSGHLPAPKRISTASATTAQGALMIGAAAGLTVLGALLGSGSFARVPLFSRGSEDVRALAVELSKYRAIADVIGVMLRTGQFTLRLGIDPGHFSTDDIIGLFSIIHQHVTQLSRFADSFRGEVHSVAQGLILFAERSRAKQFIENIAEKCMHGSIAPAYRGGPRVVTQPWVVDLEDEKLTTCAGWRQFRRQVPLDAKAMLPRLFQKRLGACDGLCLWQYQGSDQPENTD